MNYLLTFLIIFLVACSNVSNIPYEVPEDVKTYEFAEDLVTQSLINNTLNPKLTAYLTFDDFNEFTNKPQLEKILSVLAKYNAKATFFVNCERLYTEPSTLDLIKLISSKGHVIGNHSYDHFKEALTYAARDVKTIPNNELPTYYISQQSPVRFYTMYYGLEVGINLVRQQISKCDLILSRNNIKTYKKIFRPPFGIVEPVLLDALSLNGYTTRNIFLWDVDTCDYRLDTTANDIRDAILLGNKPKSCSEGSLDRRWFSPIRHNSVISMHWADNSKTPEGLELTLKVISPYFTFRVLPEMNTAQMNVNSQWLNYLNNNSVK